MPLHWICTTETKPWQRRDAAPAARNDLALRVTAERFQWWEGFGGCFNELGWDALSVLGQTKRREVLKSLFHPQDGCRFNLCRLPIGASDYALEWHSLNETDGDLAMRRFSIERDRRTLIPYIRAAMEYRPDLTLFASPWSPPTWMKFPRAYNYGTLLWRKDILDAYALYFVKFIQAYDAEGIGIHQVHPQNEPVADQKFPSCLWTANQMRDFIRDHLAPAFRKHKIASEIWIGTLNTDDYANWALTILSDPKARQAVSGVGYQWAGKGAVQRTRMAWPALRLMQTENECGDGRNDWAHAQHVFELLHHYITNGVNAYVYWNMVLPPGGLSTWGWRQNAMITVDKQTRRVHYNPEFYVMKHFSACVAPGATRLGTAGPWSGNAVAFANPDGSVAVMLHNPLQQAISLRLEALEQAASLSLPPQSFHTVLVR